MTVHILTPAYGRDYRSRAAILADFHDGKDFLYSTGFERPRPINKPQLLESFCSAGRTASLQFRYGNLRKVWGCQLTPNGMVQ